MRLTSGQAQSRGQKVMARAGPGGRKKMKPANGKGFGKKGGKRRNKEMKAREPSQVFEVPPQPSPEDKSTKALVRYGEGIVVDWNDDAFDIVFGKSLHSDDEDRGAKTFVKLDTITDPALAKRRSGRESRRKHGCTLEECLDEFERAEVLSEHDEWYCPRCKEHRRASKKFDLWKSPDILVVHLKRFSSAGFRREKLDVLVQFPIENLDLTTRVLNKEDGKEEIFDLIAVDEHSGGLGGGHYTAAAKNFIDGRWYHFNGKMQRYSPPPSAPLALPTEWPQFAANHSQTPMPARVSQRAQSRGWLISSSIAAVGAEPWAGSGSKTSWRGSTGRMRLMTMAMTSRA